MAVQLEPVTLDWEGFVRNVKRQGTPDRVFFFEHGIDPTIAKALDERYDVWKGIDPSSPTAEWDRAIAVNEFLGLELVRVFPPGARVALEPGETPWEELSKGPITTWEEFEAFPWPSAKDADLSVLEYYEKALPDNMRAMHVMDLWEITRAMFGFETFCYTLYEDPKLIQAVLDKVGQFNVDIAEMCCQFDCYGVVYQSDDLGYKTSTMLPPDTIRQLIMPWHKKLAGVAHRHGKMYFFHCCGQMYSLMDEYIDDVKIDAKHSFEDVIMPVTEASKVYGDRVGLLGGMDVDLLARQDEQTIRAKTREVLDGCVAGGGYCLGAGNWVTSYIPVDKYLVMVDEGRRYAL